MKNLGLEIVETKYKIQKSNIIVFQYLKQLTTYLLSTKMKFGSPTLPIVK